MHINLSKLSGLGTKTVPKNKSSVTAIRGPITHQGFTDFSGRFSVVPRNTALSQHTLRHISARNRHASLSLTD